MRFLEIGDSVPVVWPGDELRPEAERVQCSAKILTWADALRVAGLGHDAGGGGPEWQDRFKAGIELAGLMLPTDRELIVTPAVAGELLFRVAQAQTPDQAVEKKSASPSPAAAAKT